MNSAYVVLGNTAFLFCCCSDFLARESLLAGVNWWWCSCCSVDVVLLIFYGSCRNRVISLVCCEIQTVVRVRA